jgi:hypothetical protein
MNPIIGTPPPDFSFDWFRRFVELASPELHGQERVRLFLLLPETWQVKAWQRLRIEMESGSRVV